MVVRARSFPGDSRRLVAAVVGGGSNGACPLDTGGRSAFQEEGGGNPSFAL